MMPLTLAEPKTEYVIQRVRGNSDCRTHLENMGFVTGGIVSVVSRVREDLIVNVKDTRVAISKEAALKIMV